MQDWQKNYFPQKYIWVIRKEETNFESHWRIFYHSVWAPLLDTPAQVAFKWPKSIAIKIGAHLSFDPEFWPNLFLPGLPVLYIVFTPGTLPIVCYVPPQPLLSFQGLATLSTNVFLQAQVEKVDVVSQSWSLPKLFGAVLADVLVNCWRLLRGIGRPLNNCFPGHKSKGFSVCQSKCRVTTR